MATACLLPVTGRNGFVNPAQPAVQERALNIIKEIVTKYNVDGLILDYARYADIYADFSDYSKNQFISFLKDRFQDNTAATMSFPKDIVSSVEGKCRRGTPQCYRQVF